jgi:type IV pilus assembly protein PilB
MNSLFREGSLGAILYKSQIITEKDIATALEAQKETGLRFGETLVSLGIVRQEDIDWALSHQLNIPYVRIRKETVDPAVLSLVPASVARRFNLLPIVRIGDELGIAIADPLNKEAIAEVERVSGCTVSVSMGLLREILEMQSYFYGNAMETEFLGFSSSCFPASDLETINNDVTGANLLDFLLFYLIKEGISSLSFKPLKESVMVNGRRGTLSRDLGTLSLAHYDGFLATTKKKAGITGSCGISSCGTLRFVMNDEQVPFQVILVQAGPREYMTLKPQVNSPFPENVAALETSERNREVLRRVAAQSGGMVLFASMDAEERARLMGACLQEDRRSGKDILLLGRGFYFCADNFPVLPVDRHDAEMSRWIRAALLHDPEVIAIEEITDSSAFAAAFDAVSGGKLLFGGVSAPGVSTMLKQLFLLREKLPMLPLSLRGVVACRGVHVLCPVCKEEDASPGAPNPLPAGPLLAPLFRPRGCPLCCYTGYTGKRYLVEAALFDKELAAVFDRAERAGEIMEHLMRNGFHGIVEEADKMLGTGEITADEYISVSMENGARLWPE